MKYEIVCGLEVHVEMNTKTKIFCGCTTAFGGAPNTHTCPVCTGQPGALPVLNRAVVEGAMSTGLALGCEITRLTRFDRKNYFYPDLPKAYQIHSSMRPSARAAASRSRPTAGRKSTFACTKSTWKRTRASWCTTPGRNPHCATTTAAACR